MITNYLNEDFKLSYNTLFFSNFFRVQEIKQQKSLKKKQKQKIR
jgi:hypothetical protein